MDWVRELYEFAPKPDLALYYRTPLEVSLNRILRGRPVLKYHEAGMDMGLSSDPQESFKLYQGRIQNFYDEMASNGELTVLDATADVHTLQEETRKVFNRVISLTKKEG